MDRFPRPQRQRRRVRSGRRAAVRLPVRQPGSWAAWAAIGLVLVTGLILLVNQQQSGDPLKIRRELRKF